LKIKAIEDSLEDKKKEVIIAAQKVGKERTDAIEKALGKL
jgi:uncharacterized protein YunC (DUF1805 family)